MTVDFSICASSYVFFPPSSVSEEETQQDTLVCITGSLTVQIDDFSKCSL